MYAKAESKRFGCQRLGRCSSWRWPSDAEPHSKLHSTRDKYVAADLPRDFTSSPLMAVQIAGWEYYDCGALPVIDSETSNVSSFARRWNLLLIVL